MIQRVSDHLTTPLRRRWQDPMAATEIISKQAARSKKLKLPCKALTDHALKLSFNGEMPSAE